MLEEIIFKANLRNEVFVSLGDKKIDMFNNSEMMDEIAVSKYEILICSIPDDDESEKRIGKITGSFINVAALHKSDFNAYEVLDEVGSNECESYSYFYDENEDVKYDNENHCEFVGWKENIFHLDTIYINKKYRKQGIAKKIMEALDDIILCVLHLQVGVITFQVEPFENGKDNKIEDINRLEKFYEKCGYKRISGIEKRKGKFSQFYKNTDLI